MILSGSSYLSNNPARLVTSEHINNEAIYFISTEDCHCPQLCKARWDLENVYEDWGKDGVLKYILKNLSSLSQTTRRQKEIGKVGKTQVTNLKQAKTL